MIFFVYIIYSASLNRYYVGSTGQLDDRLYRHRNSGSKSTKKAKDWTLKYTESFDTYAQAVAREMHIKKMKSRSYIEFLIASKS